MLRLLAIMKKISASSSTAVFIDLEIDSFLEQRKMHANFRFVNQRVIETNLNEFMKRNANFSQRVVNSIGLHSKNLTQGEVF